MTATTPIYGLPYPDTSDAPNGPAQLGALALAVETRFIANAATDVALDGRVATLETGVPLGAWSTWVPTLTQSGAVPITITSAKWTKVGKTIHVHGMVAVTGAGGVAGQAVVIGGLPAPIAVLGLRSIGSLILNDSGTAFYTAMALPGAANTLQFLANNVAQVIGQAGFAAALAAGDTLGFSVTYETT